MRDERKEEMSKEPKLKPKTIYKYPLQLADISKVEMDVSAEILKVESQGAIMIWTLVDSDPDGTAKTKDAWFRIAGTGHKIHPVTAKKHLATVFNGPFVWHIFGPFGEKPHV
jgi:hypothetical protein